MPRSTGTLVNSNFAKGLITEASPFTFPQGACAETFDCVHLITGGVTRRKGFDWEINHSVKQIDRNEGVVNSYLWKDVSGDGNTSLVVVQIADHLYFWDGSTTDPLSAHPISAHINLNSFSPSGAPSPKSHDCQFASGNGKLFVAHPNLESFALTYDANTQTFTTTEITLEIRDFEGLEDDLAVDTRPNTGFSGLSTAHKYNLFNQGWTSGNLTIWGNGGSTLGTDGNYSAIGGRNDMPSNVDVMWSFKNSQDVFDLGTVTRHFRGNSPAPKGHFIFNAYTKDRSTPSGLGIANDSTGYQRASTIAFFSGRIFYSGVDFVNRSGLIYFTQIIERDSQFGQCYQVNDPTSDTTFDLLPSDGGVIRIQEAGAINKLFPVAGGLLVFAANGVWVVTGSTGLGFTANDYSVSKISAIQTLTASSFVDVAGTPMWWNLEGIYRVEATQGGFGVSSITSTTIDTFYNQIPPSEKRNARGFFNPTQYTVQWCFSSTESTDLNDLYAYDRILNLDIRTGAFFVWTLLSHPTITLHGMVTLENRGGDVSLDTVFNNDGTTIIYDNDGVTPIQTWTISNSIVIPNFKYVISYTSGGHDYFTFAEARREDYTDWVEYDNTGIDFTSYFISGYTVPNATVDFESNYVLLYNDTASKYNVQGLWDFSNTGDSGRWANKQLIDTSTNTNYDKTISRRKIRGRGKTLQMKISSYPGSNFKIEGWGTFLTGNQMP